MSFTLKEYRLEYTVWAAYRAAQAGSSKAKGPELSEALKQCGVIEYVDSYKNGEVTLENFEENHKIWCKSVISFIENKYNKKITYGIAAKLIGVFLKGYFILAGNENTALSKVIHPPIDSYLLKGVDKAKGTKLDKTYKWQKLDVEKYFELLAILKNELGQDESFWYIEKHWKLS